MPMVEGESTRVLIELGTIDVNRLGDCVGQASREEIWGIDESLMTVLALR